MAAADDLVLESPGPGTWERDPVHFPRPVSGYFADTHPPAFGAGTSLMFGHYGLLLERMAIAYPNGFAYNCKVPAADADIPARFGRAEEALATQGLARPAPGVGRGGEARPRSPSTARSRRSTPTRSPTPTSRRTCCAAATTTGR